MNEMDTLANQHFLEWELRLKKIDEMMIKVSEAHTMQPARPEVGAELAAIQKSRESVALQIDSARKMPANQQSVASHHTGVIQTTLASIGQQMEKLLSSVVGAD